jgi:hypothetical protein
MVAPPVVGPAVRDRQEGVCLWPGEVADDSCASSLGRDSEHAPDRLSVLGTFQGGVLEQRVHGREAQVARTHAVVPGSL